MKQKYLIIIILLFAYSCKENSNPVKYEPIDSTKFPIIYSFTPSHGYPKSGVLIYGKNFYSTTDTIKILFGDKLAPILGNWQVNDTSIIQTKVPDSALTSKIIVKRNQYSGISKDYFYVDFKDSNKVINFTPKRGIIGTKVEIIINQYLSSLLAKYDNKLKIFFGNIEATISNIAIKSIETNVPEGASTAKIKLLFDTVICISKDIFTVGKPSITSVMPNQGRPGDTITITGDYFLCDKSNIKLKFGNTDAQILDANETQIKTMVPQNAVTSKIYITIFKENAETNDNFIILKHIIDSFEPKIGTYGTKVTIYGKYFGNNSNDIKIYFNNVEAIVSSFQDNKIETKVPNAVKERKNVIKVLIGGGIVASKDTFNVELSPFNFKDGEISFGGFNMVYYNKYSYFSDPNETDSKNWFDTLNVNNNFILTNNPKSTGFHDCSTRNYNLSIQDSIIFWYTCNKYIDGGGIGYTMFVKIIIDSVNHLFKQILFNYQVISVAYPNKGWDEQTINDITEYIFENIPYITTNGKYIAEISGISFEKVIKKLYYHYWKRYLHVGYFILSWERNESKDLISYYNFSDSSYLRIVLNP